mmetsp:Transcript_24055/g.75937  ORF Transcript_24055/g.75937 Transcript_24055/m.75937 type:complete len:224 (+) Transcript_24055:995-1666(+)
MARHLQPRQRHRALLELEARDPGHRGHPAGARQLVQRLPRLRRLLRLLLPGRPGAGAVVGLPHFQLRRGRGALRQPPGGRRQPRLHHGADRGGPLRLQRHPAAVRRVADEVGRPRVRRPSAAAAPLGHQQDPRGHAGPARVEAVSGLQLRAGELKQQSTRRCLSLLSAPVAGTAGAGGVALHCPCCTGSAALAVRPLPRRAFSRVAPSRCRPLPQTAPSSSAS